MSPRRVTEPDQEHFYRVRVVLPGALLHLASRDEPRLIRDSLGRLEAVEARWVRNNPEAGDDLGYVRWAEVIAITWRWSGERAPVVDLFGPVHHRGAVPFSLLSKTASPD